MKKLVTLAFAIPLLFATIIAQSSQYDPPTEEESNEGTSYDPPQVCRNIPHGGKPDDCDDCPESINVFSSSSTAGQSSHSCDLAREQNPDNNSVDPFTFNHKHKSKDYSSLKGRKGNPSACKACSGKGPKGSKLPEFSLDRTHKLRNQTERASLGKGTFLSTDVSLKIYEDGGETRVDYFNPANRNTIRFFKSGNKFDDSFYKSVKNLELFDTNDNVTTSMAAAKKATLLTRDERKFKFEIFDLDSGLCGGRICEIEDRNGYKVKVDYEHDYQSTSVSGADKWKINTVTDAVNKVTKFHYNSEQKQGEWVVSKVDLPNGESVRYDYESGSAGKLNSVNHADGSSSTFERSIEPSQGYTKVSYNETSADSGMRRKNAFYTNNVGHLVNFTANGEGVKYFSTSSLLALVISNDQKEVEYFSMTDNNHIHRKIYKGGKKMMWFDIDTARYYNSWTFDHTKGSKGLSGSREAKFRTSPWNHYAANRQGRPNQVRMPDGRLEKLTYNSDNSVKNHSYPDGTSEKYEHNAFQQPTRYEDRDGRVTRYTYDARGNLTERIVGLKMVNGVETQTPEYVIYRFEYYPEGHDNQFLLRYEFDANNNRKEYIYNEDNLITEVHEPDDEGTGYHLAMSYTYDSAKRLKTQTDAVGRVTTFDYDKRNRFTKTTYNDTSTELNIYGTGDLSNLILKIKDRNGNVTKFEYDSSDRVVKTITAYSVMNKDGSTEDVNDPQVQSVKTCEYLTGTQLLKSCVTNGERVDYTYDHRHRLSTTTSYPRTGVSLTTRHTYLDNLTFKKEDPYGRKTFYSYRSSDSLVKRKVEGTVPSFNLNNYAEVNALSRDGSNNASYIIIDYEYDLEGNLTAIIDGRGIRHEYGYDSRSRKVSTVIASGTVDAARTEMDYDLNSNNTEIRHPRHFSEAGDFISRMEYTRRNKLLNYTEAVGTVDQATESYTYYNDGRPNITTDFRGHDSKQVWHQCCGRIQAIIDQAGHGQIINNDYHDNKTHVIHVRDVLSNPNYHNPRKAKTLYEVTARFDSRHRQIASTKWMIPLGEIDPNNVPIAGGGKPGDPAIKVGKTLQGLTSFVEYFDEVVDDQGAVIDHRLNDIYGKLQDDGVSFDGVHQKGSAVLSTNPQGDVRVTVFDGVGRSVINGYLDSSDSYKAITWSSALLDTVVGSYLEESSINGLDYVTKVQIDGIGRRIKLIDAENKITYFEYDANKNQLSFTDPNGVGETCTYDFRNREIECQDTEEGLRSVKRKRSYDTHNNVLTITDAKNAVAVNVYDSRDRNVSNTDRIGAVTLFTYDKNNNELTVTDAENKTTLYKYNYRNLLMETELPDHVDGTVPGNKDYGLKKCSYDAMRRKLVSTDQKGDTVTYKYDLANRMVMRDYRERGSSKLKSRDLLYYDKASRLIRERKGRYFNLKKYTYDKANRLESENTTVFRGGKAKSYTIGLRYDDASRRTSCTYPDGKVVDYTYTSRNQLETISYNGNQVSEFDYDPGMREVSRTYANGLTTETSYGRSDNLKTRISVIGKPGLSLNYQYDVNKNITDENYEGVISDYSWSNVSYDAEDRLDSWSRNNNDSRAWDLDFVGNMKIRTVDGIVENREHSDAHEVTKVANKTLSYDSKGNLTRDKNKQRFIWDIDNHLQQSRKGKVATTYSYDTSGLRVSKKTGKKETVYVSLRGQVLVEYNQKGKLLRSYLYGSYIDEPIVMINGRNGKKIFYHSNRQYSIIGLSDSNGNVVERYAYTPYGERIVFDNGGYVRSASVTANPYGFTGRRLDNETGLHYFRARYYSAELSRFISRDPIGYIDGMSLYRGFYIPNGVDPNGELTRSQYQAYIDHIQKIISPPLNPLGEKDNIYYKLNEIAEKNKKFPDLVKLLMQLRYKLELLEEHGEDWASRVNSDASYRGEDLTIDTYDDCQDYHRSIVVPSLRNELVLTLGSMGWSALSGLGVAAGSGTVLSKGERIAKIMERIKKINAKNADDALKQINKIVDDVEDAYSGVKKASNPGKKYDGRMYGPRSDSIIRNLDGSITAKINKGTIDITKDGVVSVISKSAKK